MTAKEIAKLMYDLECARMQVEALTKVARLVVPHLHNEEAEARTLEAIHAILDLGEAERNG